MYLAKAVGALGPCGQYFLCRSKVTSSTLLKSPRTSTGICGWLAITWDRHFNTSMPKGGGIYTFATIHTWESQFPNKKTDQPWGSIWVEITLNGAVLYIKILTPLEYRVWVEWELYRIFRSSNDIESLVKCLSCRQTILGSWWLKKVNNAVLFLVSCRPLTFQERTV